MDAEAMNEMEVDTSETDEDTRCVTTFTYSKENFSRLGGIGAKVLSPPCMIQNIPWSIWMCKFSNKEPKSLGLCLQSDVNSENTSWSCHATVELSIVSQMGGINNFSRKKKHTFSQRENIAGWTKYMEWDNVVNPNNGLIDNDTVIFLAEVNADSPLGIPSNHQTSTSFVSLKNQRTICDWNSLSYNLSTKCEMDFKLWAPLSDVNQSILDRVRLVYVFGHKGSEALIISEDDEVWARSLDDFSCFSFGDDDSQDATRGSIHRVDVLNKQGVRALSFGLNESSLEVYNEDILTTFLVVCTSSGNVFQFGRLNATEDDREYENDIIPVSELGCLPKISEVACGSNHCLALSTTGQVFSWGSNECGQIGSGNTSVECYDIPYEIVNGLKNKCVVKISCGFSFSVVVLDDGRVYTWGRDVCEDNKCQYLPVLVPLNGVVIREIACGFSHVFAVTNNCELYVWGMNDRGQLGLGDDVLRSVPTKNKAIEKVVDIAASYLSYTSAAITVKHEVFMWGVCLGSVVREPMKTPYKSLMEVFAYFGTPKITYKPIIRQSQSHSMSDIMRRAFNDKTSSDLIIKADGKEIFVHRTILKLSSDYFRVFLQDQWNNENQKTVEVNRPYNVIYSYLQYLYSGEFEADAELTQDLLVLADEYQDLPLKELCEEKIQCHIKVDNVGILFPLALKLNAKKLQESCISFASCCVSDVMKTPAFRTWDKDALIEFLAQCDKRGLFKKC